jgi:hypothetical protein
VANSVCLRNEELRAKIVAASSEMIIRLGVTWVAWLRVMLLLMYLCECERNSYIVGISCEF